MIIPKAILLLFVSITNIIIKYHYLHGTGFNEERVYTDFFFNGFKKEVNPYLKQ